MLKKLPSDALVICGIRPGLDAMARHVAQDLGLEVTIAVGIPPLPLPTVLLAFHPDIANSRGTWECLRTAWIHKVPGFLHRVGRDGKTCVTYEDGTRKMWMA